MKVKRLLAVMLALTVAAMTCSTAFASDSYEGDTVWPDGTPTVYIGFGAGGGTDTAIRPVIAAMSEYLGENITCTNMEGANSAVACDYVLEQPHDGYTIFGAASGPFSAFPTFGYSDSMWEDWISFHPFTGPVVVFANNDLGISTIEEVFDYMQDNNFGVGAIGNGAHVRWEAICDAAGVDSPEYSVFGSCADTAVATIAGDVMVGAGSLSAIIDYIQAGMLTPIAVTCEDPFYFDQVDITTPSITTLVEGTDYLCPLDETWPIMVPRDTPQEIVDALTEAFEYAITTPEVVDYADQYGFNIVGYTGEEADQFLAYQLSGYSWIIEDSDIGEVSPENYDIPRLDDYDWEVEKLKIE